VEIGWMLGRGVYPAMLSCMSYWWRPILDVISWQWTTCNLLVALNGYKMLGLLRQTIGRKGARFPILR